jgi:hypothetical protein
LWPLVAGPEPLRAAVDELREWCAHPDPQPSRDAMEAVVNAYDKVAR